MKLNGWVITLLRRLILPLSLVATARCDAEVTHMEQKMCRGVTT